MESILPLKQLIQRKHKQYKLATHDHVVTLQKALEKDTQQRLKNLTKRSVSISVPNSTDLKSISGFTINNLPESRVDERLVLVQTDTKQKVAEGVVVAVNHQGVKIKLDKKLTLKGEENVSTPSDTITYKIQFEIQDVLDRKRRIENTLVKFRHVSCSQPLHKSLLGNYKDWCNDKYAKGRVIFLNDSLKLKGSQLKAVEESMKKRISLIEGVAGSGKTLVAATLAYSMQRCRNKKILVCSPIQATVDRLADLLNRTENVLVVKITERKRIVNRRRLEDDCSSNQSSKQELESCSLESLIESEIFERSWQRTKRIYSVSQICHTHRVLLHRQAKRVVKNSSTWLKKQVERQILQKADVVCCTLVQAGDPCLKELTFDMLIIDDLQAASELDCMIPMMMKGLEQVTLISEMRREIRSARSNRQSLESRPLVNGRGSSKTADGLKLAEIKKCAGELVVKQAQEPGGLFERLLSIGLTAVPLRNQFRMHETLAAFSNHHFYLSQLRTDKETNKELTRQICNNLELDDDRFKWLPNNKCPTAFFDTLANGSSPNEVAKAIINKLTREENVNKSRIAVITNDCTNAILELDDIEIGTVEDFQGQERDFIVLLAGNDEKSEAKEEKSDSTMSCNFLRDEDALLIAITRARLGQFIVGELIDGDTSGCQTPVSNQESASSGHGSSQTNYCESWKALTRYYSANKLVVHVPSSGLG